MGGPTVARKLRARTGCPTRRAPGRPGCDRMGRRRSVRQRRLAAPDRRGAGQDRGPRDGNRAVCLTVLSQSAMAKGERPSRSAARSPMFP